MSNRSRRRGKIFVLQEIGVVLHLAKSGRLIVKVSRKLEPGVVLSDAKGRRIARVVETTGPVSSPYASAVPLTDRVKRALGSKVYVLTPKHRG